MPLIMLPEPFDILVMPINYVFDLAMSQIKAKLEAMIDVIIDTLTNTFSAIGKTYVDLIVGLIDVFVSQYEAIAAACVSLAENVLAPIVESVTSVAETILNKAFDILEVGTTKIVTFLNSGFDAIVSQMSLGFNLEFPEVDTIDFGLFRSTIDAAFQRTTNLIDNINPTLPEFAFPEVDISEAMDQLGTLETRANTIIQPIASQVTSVVDASEKQLERISLGVNEIVTLPSTDTVFYILLLGGAAGLVYLGIILRQVVRI
jgi:hypothetical protein